MSGPPTDTVFTLSPSKAETFASCRRKYDFKYRQRLPDPQDYERHPAALIGTAVHRAMHTLGDTGRRDRMEETYASYLSTPEHEVAGPLTQYYAKGLDLLANGYEAHQELLAAAPTHHYEHSADAQSGPFRFWTKMDRVAIDATGGVTVVDWKTGGAGFWGPSDDLQAMALHVTARASFNVHADTYVRVLLWNLRSGDRDERVETREHAIAAVRNLRAEARRMMQTKEFGPSPGPLCRWCPFLDRCPEGQAATRPRDRAAEQDWLEVED